MRTSKGTFLATLVCCSFMIACKTRPSSQLTSNEDTSNSVLYSKMLKSLSFAFYQNNSMPPPPNDIEITKSQESFVSKGNSKTEIDLLKKIFGNHFDIAALASRDTDGDGIKDFRVSHYDGKFQEGDLDVDGDGIENTFDAAPYEKKTGGVDTNADGIPDQNFLDRNKNKIPDHIDFAIQNRDLPDGISIADIQQKLFDDFKIILVERDDKFNLKTATAVADAVTKVFKSKFKDSNSIPTLRTIATEKRAMLEIEKDGVTNAMVVTPTHSLIVYESGLKAKPLVKLGLLVHEIGHSIQYATDYKEKDSLNENSRIVFPQPKFFSQMAEFEWSSDSSPIDKWKPFKLFTTLYEIVRPNFRFKGKSTIEWESTLNKMKSGKGNDYLNSQEGKSLFLVSDYSLTDPFEWMSDNLIAYVFSELEFETAKIEPQYSSAQISAAIAKNIEKDWPGFRYQNIQGAPYYEKFKSRFPISTADRRDLAQRYVLPLLSNGSLGLQAEEPETSETQPVESNQTMRRHKL